MIDPARLRPLNDRPATAGKFVLYWMQASQRTRCNHALEYAIERGDQLDLPVVVCFGVTSDYPEANARHYAFMLQGLADVRRNLAASGIKILIKRGSPPQVALGYAKDAALLVCDRGYMRHQKRWRDEVADAATCEVVEVESDVVVPVEIASDKREFAARTIRPKIQKQLKRFLRSVGVAAPRRSSLRLRLDGDSIDLEALRIDRSVAPVQRFEGGEDTARARLRRFTSKLLNGYASRRTDPSLHHTSTLSPYLHFGHISPIEIALAAASKAQASTEDREAYLEELIVRRELAINFVHYTPNYDSYDAVPAWSRQTLEQHCRDPRPHIYSREQLERAATHDPYWNAAQNEMLKSGYMHNSMRMYWGKKIIEWKRTPREAYGDAIYLNNKYFLDGRDPNAWANVAWLFGQHDRPWTPRKIFGTVRYMNAQGLRRKFDIDAYIQWVDSLPPPSSVNG